MHSPQNSTLFPTMGLPVVCGHVVGGVSYRQGSAKDLACRWVQVEGRLAAHLMNSINQTESES